MSIHEHLPPQVRKGLKEVGWTKGLELAKLARKAGRALRKCNLVAQGSSTAEGRLKREVEKELAGKDSEPSELGFLKVVLAHAVLRPSPRGGTRGYRRIF
jgi:hypothetical protein